MTKEIILDLKVYRNKRTGQATVILPKKKSKKEIPDRVKIIW